MTGWTPSQAVLPDLLGLHPKPPTALTQPVRGTRADGLETSSIKLYVPPPGHSPVTLLVTKHNSIKYKEIVSVSSAPRERWPWSCAVHSLSFGIQFNPRHMVGALSAFVQ